MFRYLSNKKVKKCQKETESILRSTSSSEPAPVLDAANEDFLQRVISGNDASSTPLDIPGDLDLTDIDQAAGGLHKNSVPDRETKETQPIHGKKAGRFSFETYNRKFKKKAGLHANLDAVAQNEAAKEEDELSKVLDDLNLTADNNHAFFICPRSRNIIQKFTVILKDLINGVPTAYNDLVHLLDDSDATLNNMYEKLPDFIKVLVTKLPDKLKGHLAPELVAVAAQVPGLAAGSGVGIKELIAKPGVIFSLIRTIMNTLKLRWPAFMGTNILMSMALFVLLFVFWYCHKRGREERLKQETTVNSENRVEELADDKMIEGS